MVESVRRPLGLCCGLLMMSRPGEDEKKRRMDLDGDQGNQQA